MSIWHTIGNAMKGVLGEEPSSPKPTRPPVRKPPKTEITRPGGRWQAPVEQVERLKQGDHVFMDSEKRARLGEEIAIGGEGRVFALERKRSVLIKIYKKTILKDPALRDETRRRIESMSRIKKLAQCNRFAWPQYSIFNHRKKFIGFGMARVPGPNLESIATLSQIQERFPNWNRLQLARLSLNLVEGLHFLHNEGVLVGDLSPSNIQFCPEGLKIYFIDCDSYQIQANGASFCCPGFVDLYTAPEVTNGREIAGRRQPESEYFSAAILIFRLLMFGIHPFACRGQGDPVSNMRHGRFPWADSDLQQTPMGSWNGYWHPLPAYLKDQFKRAFSFPQRPASRPDLVSWKQILARLCHDARRQPHLARIPRFNSQRGPSIHRRGAIG